MKNIFLILSFSFLSLKRRFKKPSLISFLKIFSLILFIFGFWIASYIVCFKILYFFKYKSLLGELLFKKFFYMVFLTLFIMLYFSNLITSLSSYFLAEDLNLILSLPLKLNEIYISRFFITLILSSWMIALFGFPIFIACGEVSKVDFLFYIKLIFLLIFFILIPCSLGIFTTLILVNFLPARKTSDFFAFISVLFFAGVYILFRLLQPEKFVNPEIFKNIADYFKILKVPSSPYIPSFWATESLIFFIDNTSKDGLFYLVLLFLTSVSLLILTNDIFKKLYFSGWSKASELKRRNYVITPIITSILFSKFKKAVRSLLIKDLLIFLRDVRQWSQIFLIFALVYVYLYNFKVIPLNKLPASSEYIKNIVYFLNIILASFIISALSLRFVFPFLSIEGKTLWIIKSSPIREDFYINMRFFYYLIPAIIISFVLLYFSNKFLKINLKLVILCCIFSIFICSIIISLSMLFGVSFPDFSIIDVNQASLSYGGITYIITSIALITLIVFIQIYPLYFGILKRTFFKVFLLSFVFSLLNLSLALILLRFCILKLKSLEITS